MSQNLPMLPSNEEWAQMKEIAIIAVKSGLLPSSIKSPEAATIIALKGRELGLSPMTAFANIHVVNGKPGCSAELLLAGIRQMYPKAIIQYVESNEKICKIKAKRQDEETYNEFCFTIEEAQRAELTKKDVWKNYPADMLRARTITRMKRALFPEVMLGLSYTPEELTELPPEVKDVTPTQPVEPEKPQTQAQSVNNFVRDFDKTELKDAKPAEPEETRGTIIRDIQTIAKEINLNNDVVSKMVKEKYNKSTTDLLDDELKSLRWLLKEMKEQKK